MKKFTEIKPEMDFYYDLVPLIEERVTEDIRKHFRLDADAEIDFNNYKEETLDFAHKRCWEYLQRLNALKVVNGYVGMRKMKHLHIEYMNIMRGFEDILGIEPKETISRADGLPL